MTAPADIPALIADGRRLIAENDGKHRYCTMDPGPHAALRMLPALLAVAEAAVEWEAADAEQRRVTALSRDTDLFERMLFRHQSATRALRAAVRGEGVLND